MSNTIAAISTAPGIGGIGIIRMSGDNCFDVLDKIFKQKNKRPPLLNTLSRLQPSTGIPARWKKARSAYETSSSAIPIPPR